jgi:alanyl-tRNA synthetase
VNKQGKKLQTVLAITKEIADKDKLNAGKLIKEIGKEIGGGGGGRPDMAQGGGTRVEGVERAINKIASLLGA